MNKKWIFLAMILLVGCATPMPKEVKIPVVVSPVVIIIPKRPYLPIAALNENSPANVTVKAYASSLSYLLGYCGQLETTLEAYNGK